MKRYVVSVLLALLFVVAPANGNAEATVAQETVSASVDLATVPLTPDLLPEEGFQLVQAGWLDLGALTYAIAGDGQPAGSPFTPVEDGFTGGYSHILGLLSDRAHAQSEPLSGAATYVLGFASEDDAELAADLLVDFIELDEPEPIDGVDTWRSPVVTTGLAVEGSFVIMFNYSFDEQRFSTRQNTDWDQAAVAEVVNQTRTRLEDAVERANDGHQSLALAGLRYSGEDALNALPWTYFPITQHYRVLDGEVLPYGGELEAEDAAPEGVIDLFVSRQQLGDDGYDHMIDVTLASFESEADARAFALEPGPVLFPPTWIFEPDYGDLAEVSLGVSLQTVRVDDDFLRATGFRTIRVDGTTVQVVQWMASENGLTSRAGMLEITAAQTACLENLPAPCAPLPQAQFPAPVDTASAESGAYPDIGTPAPRPGDDSVLASIAYGWEVLLPPDGWEITDVQFLNGEYYLLQSGRSLLTIESLINRAATAQDCLLDEVGLLEEFEERALITIGSDDPEERPAGLEQGHAWGVYTVEPLQEERADQEYTIRIDCYALVPGEVSLVVTHTAPRDLWTDERIKGERFRDALTLPDASSVALATTPSAGDRWVSGRTSAMGTNVRIWIPRAA
jgi:hypothetical protein